MFVFASFPCKISRNEMIKDVSTNFQFLYPLFFVWSYFFGVGQNLKRFFIEKNLLPSETQITVHLTLKVGSNLSHVTPYFIPGWNRWNVWFGMKESSEQPYCILYLSSFSSEYTWVVSIWPNGHWVTPGRPSNTCSKVTIPKHRTYEQGKRRQMINTFTRNEQCTSLVPSQGTHARFV